MQRIALRDGDPAAVLAAIRTVPLSDAADPEAAARVRDEVLGDLDPRVDQMRYATFRAQGLPIGSGIVESANKHVVEARMKGAGRRWAERHVTPLVALRGAVCSDRWAEAWAAIAHARHRRGGPTPPTPVAAPPASAASVAAPRRRDRSPAIPVPPRIGPKRIVDGRPTAAHPWRR